MHQSRSSSRLTVRYYGSKLKWYVPSLYLLPSESDEHGALEFKKSLDLVNREKGNIWILGDLNYPDLTWDDDDVPIIKPGCSYPSLYDDFVEMLNDFSLSQMVREPTRDGSILDLFMTTNPTLVKSISIIPGLSDHDVVRCVIDTKPKQSKQPPRNGQSYYRRILHDTAGYRRIAQDTAG